MNKPFAALVQAVLFLMLTVLIGCQAIPVLPDSIIPPGCRLSLANYTYENYSGDSTTYQYDSFGHLTQKFTLTRQQGKIVQQATYTYGYSADHYLTTRTERIVTYPNGSPIVSEGTFSYDYQGDPKQIRSIRRIAGNGSNSDLKEAIFQYNGLQLSEYRETSLSGEVISLINYGVNGKPTRVQRTNFLSIDVANGLITRTVSNSATVQYSYDGLGQPTTIITTNLINSERVERAITYDGRQPIRTGELKLKGFPENDLVGYGQVISNPLTETINRYRSSLLAETTVLRYNHVYNAQGYTLGYARSDGARARLYYTNCP